MYLRRRPLFYGFNFIIPCILISVMTILGFMLPPDAGEKISLQITVLLSVSVLLSIVSNMVPPTSEAVPLLGTFFSVCMVFCTLTLVVTVYVLNLHHATPDMHTMDRFTDVVLLNWLPWLLGMHRPHRHIKRSDLKSPFSRDADSERDKGSGVNMADLDQRVNRCCKLLARHNDLIESTSTQAMLMLMHRTFVELKSITKRMADEDEAGDLENEWKFAAAVVDRAGLIGFTLMITFLTAYIFFTAPYLSADADP